jgi:hypothetical protein
LSTPICVATSICFKSFSSLIALMFAAISMT